MFQHIEKIKKHDMILSVCLAIVYLYAACSPIESSGIWPGLFYGGGLVVFFIY